MARSRGHDVIVAAPRWDSSGSSASVTGVTAGRDVVFEPRRWDGWEDGAVFSVHATPALICRAALQATFGPPPDIVLSGINAGANTGRAIIHSGTVGAAFTAYIGQRRALAMSLAEPVPGTRPGFHWATAAQVAAQILDWLTGEDRPVVINCNVPDVPLEGLRGIEVATLARKGTAQTSFTEQEGELFSTTVSTAEPGPEAAGSRSAADGWPGVPLRAEPLSDVALLKEGYASVTAVRPVQEDATVDLGHLFRAFRPPLAGT